MNAHLARVIAAAVGLSLTGWLAGCGSGAKAGAAATAPGAPRSVYAVPYTRPGTPTSPGAAMLTWKAPSNGGSAITGYVVTPYKAGVAQAKVTFPGTATKGIVSHLPNGRSYRFGVAARNAVGTGAMSPLSAAIIIGTPGQPGKPTIDKRDRAFTTPLQRGEVFISAARPAPNGTPQRGVHMDAKCTSSNGGTIRTQALDFSQGPAAKVHNLTVGKTYRCTVTATNKYGTGRASVPSNALVI